MLYNLKELAQKKPDKLAYVLTDDGSTITFDKLEKTVNKTVHLFKTLKLQKNDHIAVMIENSLEFFCILWASLNTGLCFTPISIHAKKLEVEYMVNNCDARLFLYSNAVIEPEQVKALDLNSMTMCLLENGCSTVEKTWEQAIKDMPEFPVKAEPLGNLMLYTSGTTGKSKGVVKKADFKEKYIKNESGTGMKSSSGIYGIYGINEDTVFQSNGHHYHTGPLTYSMLFTMLGATVLISKKFDAILTLKNIEKYKVTHCFMVPTMFNRLLDVPERERKRYDLKSLKMVMHSGEFCSVSLKSEMIDWMGDVLVEYYGGTEGSGSTMITTEEWKTHKGSVGREVHGTVHIVNGKTFEEVEPGEVGIIYFGNGSSFEYYKDREKTESVRHAKGWTTLGDVGYLDKDGYLYVTGRIDDTIISGGVNIYPKEVEDVLNSNFKVHESAVVGIKNDEFGQIAVAFVNLKDQFAAGEELKKELLQYCRENLSKIKCPKQIEFVDELPISPTGKVLKNVLRSKIS